MNMSMDKPIALNRAEGTRGPQVEKYKNDVKKKLGGVGLGNNHVGGRSRNVAAKYGGRKGNLQAF